MSKEREPAWREVYCKVNENGNVYWAMKNDNDESFIPTEIYSCGEWYDKTQKTIAIDITFKRWCSSMDL
jgi:hypothetical protein